MRVASSDRMSHDVVLVSIPDDRRSVFRLADDVQFIRTPADPCRVQAVLRGKMPYMAPTSKFKSAIFLFLIHSVTYIYGEIIFQK